MASFKGDFKSKALDMDTALNVILPYDHPEGNPGEPCKVLYLLHGQGSSAASWMRWTSIERYAMKHGIAVVMPEVQRSFYANMAYGRNYFTYVAEELPALCGKMFNISQKREDSFVAGLSMGGYGALKVGLTHPDRFEACASFSGAVDLRLLAEKLPELDDYNKREMQAIFGMDLLVEEKDDIFRLAKDCAALPEGKRPRIMCTCGTEDEMYRLYEGNLRFRDYMRTLPLEFVYREWPGTHEWGFWDVSVQYALNFFMKTGKDK